MSFKHLETHQVGLQGTLGQIPTIPFIDPLFHLFQPGAVLSDPQPSEHSLVKRKTEAKDAGFESFP